jgi:dTDP-4-amino-4,6-dideoxygalactose transaminase
MNKNIYVTMPTLAPLNEVTHLLEGIWDRGILTHNGPLVQQFEKEVKDFFKLRNMVAVSNGTIALQMAIKALELKGEIITTPFTWVATISSIIWEKCTPVFVDIDAETLNIDPQKIEEKITNKTSAIMPVHVFGNPCDIESIAAIATKHNLKVIYDAAHAVGSTYKGKSVLEYGDISATSYHATKMLNTVEGGGCIAQNDELVKKLERIRFFGHDDQKDIIEDGFNGKMTEVHAAVGIANLKYIQAALNDRKEKYKLYKSILKGEQQLSFQKISDGCNYSYIPLIFKNEKSMNEVLAALADKNIYARRYFYPSVNTFSKVVSYESMPISESIASRIICLPLYFTLQLKDVELICNLILSTIRKETTILQI